MRQLIAISSTQTVDRGFANHLSRGSFASRTSFDHSVQCSCRDVTVNYLKFRNLQFGRAHEGTMCIRGMVNNAYTQVSRACKWYSRMPDIYRRQKARERLSSWMHSVRDVIHTDTHDFYYIAEKEKKREKTHREIKERYTREVTTQSMYWMVRVAMLKLEKVYVVWNLRSLRLLCRRTILYVLIGYLSIINWIVYQFLFAF